MGLGAYRHWCRRDLPPSNLTMPCQGCVGWMGQQTGTYTKYWCPADSSFHFDWEPCGAPTPPPGAPMPPPTGGPTPGTMSTPGTPGTALTVATGGCGSCRRGCLSASATPTALAGAALSVAATTAPCPCMNGAKRTVIPWWAWVLGALGALSVLRRVSSG